MPVPDEAMPMDESRVIGWAKAAATVMDTNADSTVGNPQRADEFRNVAQVIRRLLVLIEGYKARAAA